MEDDVLALLAAQNGVAPRWQLLALVTRPRLETLVHRGELVLVRRGVYGLPGAPGHDDAAVRAAADVAAAQTLRRRVEVASGDTAARVHGLPVLGRAPEAPRLSLPRELGEAPRHDRPRTWMAEEDVVEVRGVLVTSLARTAVDLARTRPFAFAVPTADAALRAGCTREQMQAVLDRSRRWPGARSAARVVAFADPASESPLESLGRARFEEQGLPAPELQVDLGGEDGPVRVDHWWRERRTVAEADGVFTYRTGEDVVAEKLREDRLRDRGEQVVRYVWDEAMLTPVALAARVRRAFARAARAA